MNFEGPGESYPELCLLQFQHCIFKGTPFINQVTRNAGTSFLNF